MTSRSAQKGDARRQMKSAARLYAVQALFQMEKSGQSVDAVVQEFLDHRFGATYEGDEMAEGNPDLFRALVEEAVNWQSKVDHMTDRALVAKWPLGRIDSVLRPGTSTARAVIQSAQRFWYPIQLMAPTRPRPQ